MNSILKVTRRQFIKTAGITVGAAMVGINMTKEACAAAMQFVGLRQKQVYDTDANKKVYKLRKSQDNPMITKIYDKKNGFLAEGPCGHKSHHLLHTNYTDRSASIKALQKSGVKLTLSV